MTDRFMCSLSPDNFIKSWNIIIEEFDPKTLSYLDSAGRWKKNPGTMRDCISNELLYYLWKLGEEERTFFIRKALSVFLRDNFWLIAKKIVWILHMNPEINPNDLTEDEIDNSIIQFYATNIPSKRRYPILIILETLGWVVAYEAFRLNSNLRVPSWDSKVKVQQQEYTKHLQSMTNLIDRLSIRKEDMRFISDIMEHLNTTCPEFLGDIPQVIAEEHILTQKIHHLLEKARDEEKKEGILPLIIEKILPPMGIATQTSPALLRPCLRLLQDNTVEIESGIQYNASVILSILQDPRSTETLLKATESFPLIFSKIRENFIYTLGNLRERKAVKLITKVLEEADELVLTSGQGEKTFCLLLEQKEEAILALGKIGLESLQSLLTLIKYGEHPSPKLQTCLAWALGEIGKFQKDSCGGVSADIIITLLKLLKTKYKMVFEESVNALKKIDMPEFIHSLYLYNVGAVNILGLKPSQKGLYELSETVHFLIRQKGRAIIAVNGDSGTGKTYFCQSLVNGFGDIRPNEILYLMRDRKKDQKIFNRILGLKWLKKSIDPVYYHDYPFSEEEDNPEEFLSQFLEENSNIKLIILDGCRDRDYFQRVIDLFYFRDKLDVEVNFRATLSTRRFNLEERELALESVRTHLSFLEEPALEDTHIYREGKAILYDLDNSISCRLNKEEIQELFKRERIESWGDLIRIGDFKRESHLLKTYSGTLSLQKSPSTSKIYKLEKVKHEPLSHEERKFRMDLNKDIANEPHLIGIIEMNDLKPKQIRFYAQDQIAGLGKEGAVFIITFLDNRIFHTNIGRSRGFTLFGRKIFAINLKGECAVINFERNEKIRLAKTDSPALVCTALSTDKVITGHEDGSIRIWNFDENTIHVLEGHSQPILALASDYFGGIYSTSSDCFLKKWDLKKGLVSFISGFNGNISHIKFSSYRKILLVTKHNSRSGQKETCLENIIILDLEDLTFHSFPSPMKKALTSVNVHFDGRIIATYALSNEKKNETLVIISPSQKSWEFQILDSHGKDTEDCLIMGPKLITCGTEVDGSHTVRVLGTDVYVRTELNKLIALSDRRS